MINSIRNSKVITYKTMSKEDLKNAIKSVFDTPRPLPERRFVITTGIEGKWFYDWILIYGEILQCKYYTHSFNKIKSFRYFSLFNKSGFYKLKVSGKKFEFFRGTILIHTIEEVVNIWAVGSGDINSKETKEKLVEVNKYIKYLEKL